MDQILLDAIGYFTAQIFKFYKDDPAIEKIWSPLEMLCSMTANTLTNIAYQMMDTDDQKEKKKAFDFVINQFLKQCDVTSKNLETMYESNEKLN